MENNQNTIKELSPLEIIQEGLQRIEVKTLTESFQNFLTKEPLKDYSNQKQIYFINNWVIEELNKICANREISVTDYITALPLTNEIGYWASVINEGIIPFLKTHS